MWALTTSVNGDECKVRFLRCTKKKYLKARGKRLSKNLMHYSQRLYCFLLKILKNHIGFSRYLVHLLQRVICVEVFLRLEGRRKYDLENILVSILKLSCEKVEGRIYFTKNVWKLENRGIKDSWMVLVGGTWSWWLSVWVSGS